MRLLTKILPTLALACTVGLTHAQQSVTMEGGHLPKKGNKLESRSMMRNCVLMKEGKMMTLKDGQIMPMAQEITMSNGTKVMTDGSVTMSGGKTIMLHNGQCVLMDGTVTDDKMMKGKMKKASR